MTEKWLRKIITQEQSATLGKLRKYLEAMVEPGLTRRLADFTLHGHTHWENIERIIHIILDFYKPEDKRASLGSEDIFLLLSAILQFEIYFSSTRGI